MSVFSSRARRFVALTVALCAANLHLVWGQSAWPSYPNNTAISVLSAGNVGIGTPSPGSALEVNGYITLPALKWLQFKDATGAMASYFYTLASGELRIQQSANAPVRHTINGSPFVVSQQGGADLLTVL